MKFKKTFLLICLLVFLFSMAGVCANDTVMASENSLEIDKTADDVIGADEDMKLTSSDGDVLTSSHDVDGDDFKSIQDVIDSSKDGDTICLGGKTFKSNGRTIMANKSVTIVGGFKDKSNVYATLDGEKQSRIMIISANVTLKGITFVNGNASDSGYGYNANGGAIFVNTNNNLSVVNCTFNNNTAVYSGGAIFSNYNAFLSCDGCIFNFNYADNRGGAMYGGSAVNCVFNFNHAGSYGGAMYGGSAVGCVFNFNHAGSAAGATWYGSAVNCVFNFNHADNRGGAMWDGSADSCIFTGNVADGGTSFSDPVLRVFNYTSGYNSGERLIFNLTSNSGIAILNRNVAVDIFKDNLSIGTFNCLSGEGLPITLNTGSYVAVCRASDYGIDPVNVTLTVTRAYSNIVASPITVAYNSGKYLTVALRDDKNCPVSGVQLSVDINGIKKFTTDKNGRIKVPTDNLAPKTYTVKITFNGNGNYLKSDGEVKLKVKKATPKITAKKKTFKKSKKVKKYTVTLKNNKKPIAKVKLTLKIKSKKFVAKTNKKGKATFKIKKLTKKGKHWATVSFGENSCYKKVTRKVKITVK